MIVKGTVKKNGDKAVLDFTKKFDNIATNSLQRLEIEKDELLNAYDSIPKKTQKFLEIAAERISQYHLKQINKSWSYKDNENSTYGQKITPLDRVGLYVPGGKAAYPSSVLMNAIPAKIAGVKDLIMVVPAPVAAPPRIPIATAARLRTAVGCMFSERAGEMAQLYRCVISVCRNVVLIKR